MDDVARRQGKSGAEDGLAYRAVIMVLPHPGQELLLTGSTMDCAVNATTTP
jgi:hypothetical protein